MKGWESCLVESGKGTIVQTVLTSCVADIPTMNETPGHEQPGVHARVACRAKGAWLRCDREQRRWRCRRVKASCSAYSTLPQASPQMGTSGPTRRTTADGRTAALSLPHRREVGLQSRKSGHRESWGIESTHLKSRRRRFWTEHTTRNCFSNTSLLAMQPDFRDAGEN